MLSDKEMDFYLKELWRGFFITKCIVRLQNDPNETQKARKSRLRSSEEIEEESKPYLKLEMLDRELKTHVEKFDKTLLDRYGSYENMYET